MDEDRGPLYNLCFFLGGTKGKQHESICASILVENIYLFWFRGDRVWDRIVFVKPSVRDSVIRKLPMWCLELCMVHILCVYIYTTDYSILMDLLPNIIPKHRLEEQSLINNLYLNLLRPLRALSCFLMIKMNS